MRDVFNPDSLFIKVGYKVLAGVFVVLCFTHYFSFRPLWLDEKFILENIQQFQGRELFRVLENTQAFPRVHLILIQFISRPFGYAGWILRLPSLICMLGAFSIWYYLYANKGSNRFTAFVTLLAFISAYKMSYYAVEFKPYAMDVLVAALAALIIHWQSDQRRCLNLVIQDYLVAGFFPFVILFSYAGLFVFWIPAYNLCCKAVENKNFRLLAVLSVFSVIVVFIIFYFIDLRYSVNHGGLHDYWRSYFIATQSFSDFFDTFGDGLKKIVTYWYGTSKYYIRAIVVTVPFFIFGLYRFGWKVIRSNAFQVYSIGSLALVIFVELIIFGVLKKYPFTGERITLFFAPFVFWLTVEAINTIKSPKWLKYIFLWYFIVFCMVCLVNTCGHFLRLY